MEQSANSAALQGSRKDLLAFPFYFSGIIKHSQIAQQLNATCSNTTVTSHPLEKNTKEALASNHAPCSTSMYVHCYSLHREEDQTLNSFSENTQILCLSISCTSLLWHHRCNGTGTGLSPFPPSFLLQKDSHPFTLLLSTSPSCSEKHTSIDWATIAITIIKQDNQTGFSQPAVRPDKNRSLPQVQIVSVCELHRDFRLKGLKKKKGLFNYIPQATPSPWINTSLGQNVT